MTGTGAGRIAVAAAALALAALPGGSGAADAADAEWPCVQRLVPSIAMGQVWPGEPPPAGAGEDDRPVEQLAGEIAVRRTPLEEARSAVAEFARELGPQERDARLGALVKQMLQRINADRASLIAGIKRFAARQHALAERIRERRRELEAMRADDPRRAALTDAVSWDQRVFDEREDSLTYLCEQPVLLEQRAFALGREIYGHADGRN